MVSPILSLGCEAFPWGEGGGVVPWSLSCSFGSYFLWVENNGF